MGDPMMGKGYGGKGGWHGGWDGGKGGYGGGGVRGPEPGTGAKHPNFKSKVCKRFSESGNCNFAERCGFAHGEADLRTPGSYGMTYQYPHLGGAEAAAQAAQAEAAQAEAAQAAQAAQPQEPQADSAPGDSLPPVSVPQQAPPTSNEPLDFNASGKRPFEAQEGDHTAKRAHVEAEPPAVNEQPSGGAE